MFAKIFCCCLTTMTIKNSCVNVDLSVKSNLEHADFIGQQSKIMRGREEGGRVGGTTLRDFCYDGNRKIMAPYLRIELLGNCANFLLTEWGCWRVSFEHVWEYCFYWMGILKERFACIQKAVGCIWHYICIVLHILPASIKGVWVIIRCDQAALSLVLSFWRNCYKVCIQSARSESSCDSHFWVSNILSNHLPQCFQQQEAA